MEKRVKKNKIKYPSQFRVHSRIGIILFPVTTPLTAPPPPTPQPPSSPSSSRALRSYSQALSTLCRKSGLPLPPSAMPYREKEI